MNILLKYLSVLLCTLIISSPALSQTNITPNGIADNRQDAFALTHANIALSGGELLSDATLIFRRGKIVAVGSNLAVPDGYFEMNMEGRYIYPGLVDIYSSYGIPVEEEAQDENGAAENLFASERAFYVNDAIQSQFRASTVFSPDTEARENLRKLGFSSVVSFRADGIARGTSALITLGDESANESIIVPDVATHFSLDKGSSVQTVPVSLMGAVALLRQTFLDAQWYGSQSPPPFTDESLATWNRTSDLPRIMESENWQLALTSDRVGDEFANQFILKTAGDSYQQADLMKATGATLIVPLNFPEAPEINDSFDANDISLAALKHWELAPYNPAILADAEVPFVITSDGAAKDFWKNLRTAVENGLPADTAIDALSLLPARALGVEDQVGQLTEGAWANFLVTTGPLLDENTRILENWIQGNRYELSTDLDRQSGLYLLTVNDDSFDFELSFDNDSVEASIVAEDSSRKVDIELSDQLITLNFVIDEQNNRISLAGWPVDNGWQGNGQLVDGSTISWTLDRTGDTGLSEPDVADDNSGELPGTVLYPFVAHGRESLPSQQDTIIRNATVWTNEDDGVLVTDVLVRDGKIEDIGPDLRASGVVEIDGTGKHLTPGIIDEHSHIALFNINEVATNSSMVRMQDVLDSENINIYRNLAGGVVAAQLLHGSANPIGGQSALIKMRWGKPPQQLLIEDADQFIKFALGENVKRSTNPSSVRYPQTRMGVEQVFMDAFSQAREYGKQWDAYNDLSRSAQRDTVAPRRDLVRETMLEILEGERYVTSHSYVQSEINMLMHVADSFDFNINTFTHILEGYKVADKMALHGAGGSTFADWWGYKWEVRYAIPYNAALMQQAGVVVAINSDDAEMSRRLNQEAAKAVKYGNISEIDALKMITLNPARLLHLDDHMGSIREGKDADLVLWSDHPLSVYAVAETTWVDGIAYYDREEDRRMRQQIAQERARLIAKIARAKSTQSSTATAQE